MAFTCTFCSEGEGSKQKLREKITAQSTMGSVEIWDNSLVGKVCLQVCSTETVPQMHPCFAVGHVMIHAMGIWYVGNRSSEICKVPDVFNSSSVQDKESMQRVMQAVDKANGYSFGDMERRSLATLMSAAVGADFHFASYPFFLSQSHQTLSPIHMFSLLCLTRNHSRGLNSKPAASFCGNSWG